jgi:hypothetical protein
MELDHEYPKFSDSSNSFWYSLYNQMIKLFKTGGLDVNPNQAGQFPWSWFPVVKKRNILLGSKFLI